MIKLFYSLKEVESKIGYAFRNKNLLLQAFIRRSYSEENGGPNNEILEFIGDSVLNFFITKILTDNYGCIDDSGIMKAFLINKYRNEGSLTEIKIKFVKKEMLAHRIDVLGLKEFLLMGKGDIKLDNDNENSVKEDLFEAILGAIAVDSKWNHLYLEQAVKTMLDVDFYLENGFMNDKNYVALIQNWNQKKYFLTPEYEYIDLDENTYGCKLELFTKRGYITYRGIGKNKGDARYNTAKAAYNDLELNNELLGIKDEFNEEPTIENSINLLQELAQKNYISMPKYLFNNKQIVEKDGTYHWVCECVVESENFSKTASADTKKYAKKLSAYLCIKKILENDLIK